MPEATKRDWKKLVSESGGGLMFLPEQFIEKAKEWQELRLKWIKSMKETAKLELKTRLALDNLSINIRDFLSENGREEEIWTADVGFEGGALKDGEFVITITEPRNG